LSVSFSWAREKLPVIITANKSLNSYPLKSHF
jgi:hypothetical protein